MFVLYEQLQLNTERGPHTLTSRSNLVATEVVDILKPYRKHLISDTLSEEDFKAFVLETFDRNDDNAIDLGELKEGIVSHSTKQSCVAL